MSQLNLDREQLRELFDIRRRASSSTSTRLVDYRDDPYPAFARLRERAPVHEGVPHELIGYDGPAVWHGLPESGRPHFSVFSFAECDAVYRNDVVFRSWPPDVPRPVEGIEAGMLSMNGAQHRRYRALLQPSFIPANAKWWMEKWVHETVHGLIDGFQDRGRADLNIDFDAVVPLLMITGSFGLTVEQALEVRGAIEGLPGSRPLEAFVLPIVEDRRRAPQDDFISVLCRAEVIDEDGSVHRLTDEEILNLSAQVLAGGSGTTWKQMGITLLAILLTPGVLDEVTADRSLLRAAIDESLRWNVTDPMFSRWAGEDTALAGVDIPKGSVVHLVIGAANRDPARWDDPARYDIHRRMQPSLAFAGGPHICIGMHVARAELFTALDALLTRLPHLRLDPDAEHPQIIGLYERGPTHVPVMWG